MKKTLESGWPDNSGPVAELRSAGRLRPRERVVWAKGARVIDARAGAATIFEAHPLYLTPHAITDLAWLITSGWDVFVRATPNGMQVRICRTPPVTGDAA